MMRALIGISRSALGESGLSMVELLIAMLILTMVSLALFNTAMVSIAANTRNSIRDEAVRLAERRMDDMRNANYDDLDSHDNTPSGVPETLKVRQADVVYTVTNTVNPQTRCTLLGVDVSWQWRGETYTHSIATLRGQP